MSSKRKGKKGIRGVPIFYDEVKKTHGIDLTDTAWKALGDSADARNISRSELVERHGRGETRAAVAKIIAALTNEEYTDRIAIQDALALAEALWKELPGKDGE